MKELFEISQQQKKGLKFYIKGQCVGGAVTKIHGEDLVEVRNQEYDRILHSRRGDRRRRDELKRSMDYPFKSDGCSVVKDYDQAECCVRYDWLYWQGGGIADRSRADREFRRCVGKTKHGWIAPFRWLGVRLGGFGILPFFDWRWGYGWKYPRSRAPKDDDSPYTVETERATFEARLEKAREHDRQRRENP